MARYEIIGANGSHSIDVTGRDEWALLELAVAGPNGCTPIDNPAPRWSAYVHKLRDMGVDIETVHERHAGPFPGNHARYVMHSLILRAEAQDAA
ncbi:winged helix domain-containing protein [Hyphomonas oceanitis]|uniref:winged helix domain-containing protein n=1 Tax=Hyphomonas oceanitis TaxID=81033 RepID=UPI003002A401